MPSTSKLPHRLKSRREDLGYTQEELAAKTAMPAAQISHYECGRRLPSLKNLRKLMLALDMDKTETLNDWLKEASK